MISADKILQASLITEKASELTANLNQYTFRVHPDATRKTVSQAVEKTWKVTVKRVNVVNVKPKKKPDRMRRGRVGYKPGYKKAIVTLKQGDAIEIV